MSAARVRACVFVLAAAIAALAGCRTAPPARIIGPGADAAWPEQLAALERLDAYGLQGRVAVAANGQGFSASLRYAQRADRSEMSLDGPLGIGGLRVSIAGARLAVETSRGEQLDGPEARAELERRLGFALPLDEMRWWLLGIPAPGEAAVETAEDGEIRAFTQHGWRVSIAARVPGLGFALPQRMVAERIGEAAIRAGGGAPGQARMKLLVERWLP